MKTQESVSTLESYINLVLGLPLAYGDIIFRGQPKKGDLLPSIARGKQRTNMELEEKERLRQVFLLGSPHIPHDMLDETRKGHRLDLMVLAQHFGLHTRLLDWSSNPLVALWFACADRDPKPDVYVYCLETADLVDKDIYTNDPFEIENTRIVEPRLNNPRIIAQQGLFTLHKYSKTGYVPLEKNRDIKKRLHEILIPENKRKPILQDLSQLGVNERTIMPDLAGLCRYLNWQRNQ
ncbi:MAG: FRG domain-containing protein [Burkholderiales bacterium]|nr:FRG domain-containing protein [Burkholderiales bacterium]